MATTANNMPANKAVEIQALIDDFRKFNEDAALLLKESCENDRRVSPSVSRKLAHELDQLEGNVKALRERYWGIAANP